MRVLLIDDHEIFRDGLRGLIKAQTTVDDFDEASTLSEGLSVIAVRPPDLITIDLDLPDAAGEANVRRLKSAAPHAKYIVVSATEDSTAIMSSLAAGAHGYVPKRLAGREVAHAVNEILLGRLYVPACLHAQGPLAIESSAVKELRFSPRQHDIANALATGATTKVIAYDLNLSEGTVKLHLSAIYKILGCDNRAQAVANLNRRNPRGLANWES